MPPASGALVRRWNREIPPCMSPPTREGAASSVGVTGEAASQERCRRQPGRWHCQKVRAQESSARISMQPWCYSPPCPFARAQRFVEKARASRAVPCASPARLRACQALAGSISAKAMRRQIQERAAAATTANIVATASMVKFTMASMAFLLEHELSGGSSPANLHALKAKTLLRAKQPDGVDFRTRCVGRDAKFFGPSVLLGWEFALV